MDDQEKNNAHSQPNNEDANNQEDQKDPSDNLTPDHPRFKEVVAEKNELKEEIATLKDQLSTLNEKVSQRQQDNGDDDLTAEEQKSFDLIQSKLRETGTFVTKDDLRIQQRAQVYSRLEEKHDGKDGLPRFNKGEIVAFAKENGIDADSQRGLEIAYRQMHWDAIVEKQTKPENPKPPQSESPTTQDRTIPNLELTAEQVGMMSDDEYEKKRGDILAAIKPRRVIE
jgi:hypothetical protein